MLRRLYDILISFKEYVIAAGFFLLSLFLLSTNETPQMRAIRAQAVLAVGTVQHLVSFVPNYFDLRRENRALREMNLALSEEVSRLREARLQNLRLRRMVGLKGRAPAQLVAATIVGKNLHLLRNTITLDVGEADGVRPDMPVVSEAGLVGKVVATSGGYAVAQTLYNVNLRVSAKVQRSRVDGILRWDGTRLGLHNVARTLDVQPGDVVTTSEYSALFPPGIRIGVVTSASHVPGALFQSIDLLPSVEFTRLEEVFVPLYLPDSSRIAIEIPDAE